MPPKSGKKKLLPNKQVLDPKKSIIQLYGAKTGEVANKINYSSACKYKESIDKLTDVIIKFGRDNGKLVPFVLDGVEKKVFLINCSNLYIVGYQETDKLHILSDQKLLYKPSIKEYKFKDIKKESLIKVEDLHTLGYMVAEAVRSTLIKEYISKNPYQLKIENNIFDYNIEGKNNDKVDVICRDVLKKLQVCEIAHSYSKANNHKEDIGNLILTLKEVGISENEKTDLIRELEKFQPEKITEGLPYIANTYCPKDGIYKFDKHIDAFNNAVEYDLYVLGEG